MNAKIRPDPDGLVCYIKFKTYGKNRNLMCLVSNCGSPIYIHNTPHSAITVAFDGNKRIFNIIKYNKA